MPDSPSTSGTSPPSRLPWLVPPLLALVLCGICVWRWPLWGDEFFTLELTGRSVSDLVKATSIDYHPPLYFLLARGFTAFGDSWLWIRLPSLVAMVGAVALVGHTARRHAGTAAGLTAATMVALSQFSLVYGATARAYGLMILLGAALAWSVLELVTRERPRLPAVVLALTAGLCLYVHYLMVVPMATAGAGLVVAWARRPGVGLRARGLGLAWGVGPMALGGLAFVPWLLWGPATGQVARESFGSVQLLVLRYLLFPVGTSFTVVSMVLVGPLLVGVAVALARTWRGDGAAGAMVGWALAGVALPLAVSRNPAAAYKLYAFAGMLAPAAIFVGSGGAWLFRRFPRPWLPAALVALLLAPQALDVLRLPSAPMERYERGGGYHDIRREGELITAALGEAPRFYLQTNGPAAFYRYGGLRRLPYLPSTDGNLPIVAGWERTDAARASIDLPYECVFQEAFPVVLTVWPPWACKAMLGAVEAQADGYAPFLLELADLSWYQGDPEAAERYARRARLNPSTSSRPDLFVVRLMAALDRPQDVVEATDDGWWRAMRWGNVEEVTEMLALKSAAQAALGDNEAARRTELRSRCVAADSSIAGCVGLPWVLFDLRAAPGTPPPKPGIGPPPKHDVPPQ